MTLVVTKWVLKIIKCDVISSNDRMKIYDQLIWGLFD